MTCKLVFSRRQHPDYSQEKMFRLLQSAFFLLGQLNRKLNKVMQLGPFTVVVNIDANSYGLELPSIVRMHPVLHVNNLRPYRTVLLHHYVPVTTHEDDYQYDLARISVDKIDTSP
jgi:hypothetical protein